MKKKTCYIRDFDTKSNRNVDSTTEICTHIYVWHKMSHKLSYDKTIRYIHQRDPENRKTNAVNDIELTKSKRICTFVLLKLDFGYSL